MKLPRCKFLYLAVGGAALAILLLQDLAADAAEIKVLSTNAITSVTDELYGNYAILGDTSKQLVRAKEAHRLLATVPSTNRFIRSLHA
jgi:hypothetical protein